MVTSSSVKVIGTADVVVYIKGLHKLAKTKVTALVDVKLGQPSVSDEVQAMMQLVLSNLADKGRLPLLHVEKSSCFCPRLIA